MEKEPQSIRSRAAQRRNRELGIKPTPSTHITTLNVATFDQFMALVGAVTKDDMAAHLRVGTGTIYRARCYGGPVNSALGAAIGKALLSARRRGVRGVRKFQFEDFFTFADREQVAA